MTNGTSQGLFVVVAIVIFGIFVALSYTVFGDILSPAMENIVLDATNQADKRLQGYTYLDIDLLPTTREYGDYVVLDFRRIFIDDGSYIGSMSGRVGSYNPDIDAYEVSYYHTTDGRIDEIDTLSRIYVENDYTNNKEYNIVSSRVWINNKEIPVNLHTSDRNSNDNTRYFSHFGVDFRPDIDTRYDLDFYLITDNKEVFHFSKSFLLDSGSYSYILQ